MVGVVSSPASGPVWVVKLHSDMAEVEGLVSELTRHRPTLQLDIRNLDITATKVGMLRHRVHFVDGRSRLQSLELVEERDLITIRVELFLVQEVLWTFVLKLVGYLHLMVVQECPIILVFGDIADAEHERAPIAFNQFSLNSLGFNRLWVEGFVTTFKRVAEEVP